MLASKTGLRRSWGWNAGSRGNPLFPRLHQAEAGVVWKWGPRGRQRVHKHANHISWGGGMIPTWVHRCLPFLLSPSHLRGTLSSHEAFTLCLFYPYHSSDVFAFAFFFFDLSHDIVPSLAPQSFLLKQGPYILKPVFFCTVFPRQCVRNSQVPRCILYLVHFFASHGQHSERFHRPLTHQYNVK